MFRKIMLAVAALVVMPALAAAQSTVTATATVGNYADVSGSGNLAFGTLSALVDNEIDADGAGAAQRMVSFNHNVSVTFSGVPSNLMSGLLTLPVSLTCATSVGAVWSTPESCSTASFDLDVGTGLTQVTLGFGGSITAAAVAAAAAGDYTGSFTIVVTAR